MTQATIVTALGPDDPDDGDPGRQQRGMAIAAIVSIQRNRLGYQVPSQSGNGSYVVSVENEPFCTCPDFESRQERCKHVYAVEFSVAREVPEAEPEAEPDRVALGSSWTAYNLAQTNEQELFGMYLKELCSTVVQAPQTTGRPRLPISDMLLAVGLKVYSTMSGRRAMTDFRNAQESGLLSTCPSFSTAFRYMEDPGLTDILTKLIELSASPLKSVESDFAADASGFSTSVYDRWFDQEVGQGEETGEVHQDAPDVRSPHQGGDVGGSHRSPTPRGPAVRRAGRADSKDIRHGRGIGGQGVPEPQEPVGGREVRGDPVHPVQVQLPPGELC